MDIKSMSSENKEVEYIKFVDSDYECCKKDVRTLLFLKNDKWNDHGIFSMFNVHYIDEKGKEILIGNSKIYLSGSIGDAYINKKILEKNLDNKQEIRNFNFENNYCAIGVDIDYYEKLRDIVFGGNNLEYERFLLSIRDLVANPKIYDDFDQMDKSKIRSTLFREQLTRRFEENFHTLYEISRYCEENIVTHEGDDKPVRGYEKKYYKRILDVISQDSALIETEKKLEELLGVIPDKLSVIENLLEYLEENKDNQNFLKSENVQRLIKYILDSDIFGDDIKRKLGKIDKNKEVREFIGLVDDIRGKLRVGYRDLEKIGDLGQYTSLETLLYLLKEDDEALPTIRLTNSRQLNDPSEGKTLMDILFPQENCENFDVSYTFISSATTSLDSLPMWKQYGQDATGVSLTYSNSFLEKLLKKTDVKIYRMCYLEEIGGELKIRTSGSDGYNEIDQEIERCIKRMQKIAKKNKDVSRYLSSINYLVKNMDYSYENEYRMVIEFSGKNDRIVAERKPNFPIPFLYTYIIDSKHKERVRVEYSKVRLGPKAIDMDFVKPYVKFIAESIEIVEKSKIMYR